MSVATASGGDVKTGHSPELHIIDWMGRNVKIYQITLGINVYDFCRPGCSAVGDYACKTTEKKKSVS